MRAVLMDPKALASRVAAETEALVEAHEAMPAALGVHELGRQHLRESGEERCREIGRRQHHAIVVAVARRVVGAHRVEATRRCRGDHAAALPGIEGVRHDEAGRRSVERAIGRDVIWLHDQIMGTATAYVNSRWNPEG